MTYITRWREDIDFIFEWWKQYFTNERSELLKYFFHQTQVEVMENITGYWLIWNTRI